MKIYKHPQFTEKPNIILFIGLSRSGSSILQKNICNLLKDEYSHIDIESKYYERGDFKDADYSHYYHEFNKVIDNMSSSDHIIIGPIREVHPSTLLYIFRNFNHKKLTVGVICSVRHPIDSIQSWFKAKDIHTIKSTNWNANDITSFRNNNIEDYLSRMGSVMQLPSIFWNTMIVKYEDLLINPNKVFSSIFNFCNISHISDSISIELNQSAIISSFYLEKHRFSGVPLKYISSEFSQIHDKYMELQNYSDIVKFFGYDETESFHNVNILDFLSHKEATSLLFKTVLDKLHSLDVELNKLQTLK